MKKLLKDNAKLYITCLIIICLISLSVVTTKVLALAALAVFAVFTVLFPVNDCCILLFAILPFANIFKYEAGATSFFTVCELLVVVVAAVKQKRMKASFLLSVLLLATYMFATGRDSLNVLEIIKVILGLCLVYFITSSIDQSDVINITYLLSISTVLMLILSMNSTYFVYIKPYLNDINYVVNSSGHTSNIMRISGFFGDPNYCSILIITCVALLSVLYYHKKIKAEFWALLAFLVPLGFLTYSKAYFLCICVYVLFLVVFVLFPEHKGWAVVSVFVIAIVLALAVSGKIEVFNVILARFSTGDVTTGRTALNKLYLNYIWDNPFVLFFGDGIAADRIAGASNNVHNIYIEGIYKLGIVGYLLYLFTLYSSVNLGRNALEKRKLVNYFPLLFLAIIYYSLAGIMMYDYPFYVAIAFLTRDFNLLDENTWDQEIHKETREL